MANCPKCKGQLSYIQQYAQWYCYSCKQYFKPAQPQPAPQQAQQAQQVQQPVQQPAAQAQAAAVQKAMSGIWFQNYYRIRKKVLTIWNKYWVEDANKKILGFSKQKMFKLKEDIRIYTDEKMTTELFRIKQQEILDIWGTFAVIDSQTNTILGYIKRKALMSTFAWDEWDVLDAYKRPIGGIHESAGRGLARKFVPGGALIPEKMTLVLNNVPVAEINQSFKIIGDIWELKCLAVPDWFDRRVLVGGLLMMGMIERQHK
ncbi:MAG: hypothetical protein JSW28_07900 [Thermoplasmata archaeon]|nr:MAG: hypothetical protein JSW28_07900 [Thermoplasmata archaeon]